METIYYFVIAFLIVLFVVFLGVGIYKYGAGNKKPAPSAPVTLTFSPGTERNRFPFAIAIPLIVIGICLVGVLFWWVLNSPSGEKETGENAPGTLTPASVVQDLANNGFIKGTPSQWLVCPWDNNGVTLPCDVYYSSDNSNLDTKVMFSAISIWFDITVGGVSPTKQHDMLDTLFRDLWGSSTSSQIFTMIKAIPNGSLSYRDSNVINGHTVNLNTTGNELILMVSR